MPTTQQTGHRSCTLTLFWGNEPTEGSVIYMVTCAMKGALAWKQRFAPRQLRARTFLDE
jgi:hypothetical protein